MANEPFYSSLSSQEIEDILTGVNDSSGLLLRDALGQIRGAVAGQDYEVPPITQTMDPDSSTVGVVGQLLINTTRNSLFVCSSDYGGVYRWVPVRINNLTPEEIASIVSLESAGAEYQVSNSGNTPPAGEWSSTIPEVPAGSFLWTRVYIKFYGADPIVFYSVSRQGVDGSGSVSSVNGVSPDASGNVQIDVGGGDADDVTYSAGSVHPDGTVGAELFRLAGAVADLQNEVNGINTLVGSGVIV